MAQLSVWMGAGVVAAGMSAALIAGADTAGADTDTSGGTASSVDSTGPDTGDAKPEADNSDTSGDDDATDTEKGVDETGPDEVDDADLVDELEAEETAEPPDEEPEDLGEQLADSGPATEPGADASTEMSADSTPPREDDVIEPPVLDAIVEPEPEPEPAAEPESAPVGTPAEAGPGADTQWPPVDTPADRPDAVAAQRMSTPLSAPAVLAAPQSRTLQDVVQSLVMEIIGVAVRFVSGPPVAAPGTNVTVRSSSLEITEGRRVRADWYYPDGDEPPQRLIYLQHGYLGVGPMYSYTASWLADRTNSIVVAPTLSSNRYVRDGFWLGDDQVHRATAELLLGDRVALTASAVSAGFLKKYGPGAALPKTFTMVGHSLGAGVAAGAAGYYADAVVASGATSHLAGIVLLDGAPPGEVLSVALDKLDGLGAYIPVLELGAPRDEGSRRVDEALNAHRPGRFNGVVLDGGQHLDAMQGGSWLIQLVSYLYQGFPTEQNKLAAQTLIAGWINDVFAGRIDPATGLCAGDGCDGIYAAPGETISIDTPKGPAGGAVIGTVVAPVSAEFRPLSVTSLMPKRFLAIRLPG